LLNIITKNLSFFVLAFSSLCFFVLNVLLKENLSANDYGLFSIFITYLSLLSSFGMFGFEQTLLRTAAVTSKLEIQKNIFFPSLIAIFLSSFIGVFLMKNYYDISISYILFYLFSIIVVVTKLSFNLYRLLSKFFLAQLVLNFWKIALKFVILYYVFLNNNFSLEFIFSLVLVFFTFSALSLFGLINKIQFIKQDSFSSLLKKSFLFFISLLTISLLGFGDRFFIESRFGLEILGNYFFFLNIFLFPFSLFQSYIGFKEIVSFKKNFSINLLNNKIINVLKSSFIFSLLLIFVFYLIDYFGLYNLEISSNLNIIIPLIILGNIKMVYSLLSSAIGALSNDKMLYKINIQSIMSLLLICPLLFYYSNTILLTIVFIIILWFIRCIIWYMELNNRSQI
tara:strand:- start:827 stop:2014 length:1188 start_codon:yes stop_codon:yes gene_type:complete